MKVSVRFSILAAFAMSVAFAADVKTSTAPPVPMKSGLDPKFEQLAGMVRKKVPDKVIQGAYGQDRPKLTPDQVLKLRDAGASDDLLVWLMESPERSPARERAAEPKLSSPKALGSKESARGLACGASKEEQSRIATVVDPFQFESFHTANLVAWGNEDQMRKMMRTLMAERLVGSNRFLVVEREQLARIRSEQVLNTSDEVKAGSGARRGQFIGADVILQGVITVANGESSRIGGVLTRLPIPGMPRTVGNIRRHKMTVQLNYQLLDAQSSAVLRTGSAKGEAERLEYAGSTDGASGSVQRSGFRNSLVGEAATRAMDSLANELIAGSSSVRKSTVQVEGLVAAAEGDLLVMNQGYIDGLRACDSLTVFEAQGVIKDPKSGEVIDRVMKQIGTATVQQVGAKTSRVSYQLEREPRVGDVLIRKERSQP
jgi:curli biogenesis system outer membrane secretion channel CsgG